MDDLSPFSLVTEPWIRCQDADGTDALLSLRDVFDGTGTVMGLRGDSPTQDYSVLRVLLAVYWRAHRRDTEVARAGPSTWRTGVRRPGKATRGGPDSVVLDYLDQHRDRFDLLTQNTRSCRSPTCGRAGQPVPVARIVPEAESGISPCVQELLDRSRSMRPRWLIHARIRLGIRSGAVGDPG